METGRRGRDTEKTHPTPICGGYKSEGMSWLRRSHLRSKGSEHHRRPPSPRFQCWKEKSPLLLSIKPGALRLRGTEASKVTGVFS